MVQDVMKETRSAMQKGIDSMKTALQKVRTGRASISLLDGISVEYYGSHTPLNQLANLSAPEPRLLTVQPWDRAALSAIEKAILKSELGLTPSNDGVIIRIPVPPLNEERRRELVKMVKKSAEEYKVEIRNHRRDAIAMLKDFEKEKQISQDDFKRGQDEVQILTDEFIKRIDDLVAAKEKEIMEV
ncbi:MAG: Ribosome-recycling factor [Deltaproteobacteria bacterium ADurb.Bin510]|nr:MAG: Ribosome-recycling factor [Deltaproteobacteria bacterium ADurb.Bin510]